MDIRFACSPAEAASMNTEALKNNFLVPSLCEADKVNLVYSHYDRMIVGGVMPINLKPELIADTELKADYFLERREMGIINVGGPGNIVADGKIFETEKLDCVYLGRGTKSISFSSTDKNDPAKYFILSAPADAVHENAICKKADATPVQLGSRETGNIRTIYKYIHLNGIKSCRLVMGLTVLEPGSVWNSIPPHTHTRRTEVYYYFDLPNDQRLFHFMGEPQQTRHIVVQNNDAIISPPWSVHFGCGTMNYGFIWGMSGENQTFEDMDQVPVNTLQ